MQTPSRRGYALLAAVFVASLAALVAFQSSGPRKTSPPYTGDLSIFEKEGRDQRLHIDQVMDTLTIGPGKNVADIGAGSGWFAVRAARKVTDTGKVYAVDINPEAIHYVDERVAKDGIRNVTAILSKPDDPMLPANSVDVVLLLKTYHEVAHPIQLMKNLEPALRPGAKIGIIDRNGTGEDHGVAKATVVREMGDAGYRLIGEQDQLVKDDNMDYFLIFVVK